MFLILNCILRVPVTVLGHRRVKYSQMIATINKGNTIMQYIILCHMNYMYYIANPHHTQCHNNVIVTQLITFYTYNFR